MTDELSPRQRLILKILDQKESLASSKLVHLSQLRDEEETFLEQAWAKTSLERRRQIVSQLVLLSETDMSLDFSRTLAFCLHDPDETIRAQAIAGLEAEESPFLITPLIQSLKEESSAKVRAAAATALGKFAMLAELEKLSPQQSTRIYTSLLEVLDNMAELVEVRRRALEAIAPFSLPQVRERIKNAYRSTDARLKASAIYAMGRNCDTAWLTTLLMELDSDEPEMRYEAINACGELGAGEAVPRLIGLTQDQDPQIQEAAIMALGEIGGTDAEKVLRRLAKSTNTRLRQAAESALKELDFWENPLSPGT